MKENTIKIYDDLGNFLHYEKKCIHCHKKFTTTSKTKRYCSDRCSKVHNKQKIESRKRYEKVKDFERLRVRAHTLAKSIIDLLVQTGEREWKCEHCGSTYKLQIHHKNKFNFLDNTPTNLLILCEKCHAKEHSRVENELNEQGILLSEWYEPSMKSFYNKLNKNCQK